MADKFSDRDQLEFLDTVDTILLGRRTYELFVGYWPTATTDREIIADRLNTLPKLVFSNTLSEAPWGSWSPARVVRGDAVTEVKQLKAQDGKHLRRRDAQVVQEDIYSVAVGSTDGAGERECIVDVRCHRRHRRATTSGSAGVKNGHSHPENRHGPSYAWRNSACWHHKHGLV